MEKETYEQTALEIIPFRSEDVIATSGSSEDDSTYETSKII